MRSKRTGLFAVGAVAMLGAIGACSSDSEAGGDTSIQAANVRVTLMDASGNQKGSCSGVLLNATSVLLPAHCVVGKSRWKVFSPASGFSATAEVAYTYDWADYKTNSSRPDRHDLAVLRLDSGIEIQEYPKLATYPMTSKADSAARMHASGDSFDTIPSQVTMASTKGFKYSYTTKMESDESLDTGGALFGADGKTLYGIVSGKGTKSGLLYVSRVDSLIDWVSAKSSCGGNVKMSNTACAKDAGVCMKDSGSGSTSTATDSGSATGKGGKTGSDAGGKGGKSGGDGGKGGGTGTGGGSGGGDSTGANGGDSAGGGGAACGETPGICWGNCMGGPSGGGAAGGSNPGSGDGTGGSGSGSNGGSAGSGSGGGSGSGSTGGTNGGSTGGGSGSGSTGAGDGTGGSGSGSAGGTSGDGTGGSGSGSAGSGAGGSGGGGAMYGDGTGGSGSGSNAAADGPGGCDGYPNCVDDVVDYGDCGCYGSTDSYNIK